MLIHDSQEFWWPWISLFSVHFSIFGTTTPNFHTQRHRCCWTPPRKDPCHSGASRFVWSSHIWYPLVNVYSLRTWAWSFIGDLPMKHGDFPWFFGDCLPGRVFLADKAALSCQGFSIFGRPIASGLLKPGLMRSTDPQQLEDSPRLNKNLHVFSEFSIKTHH